jgi:replicative DNA helicase
VAQNNKNLRLPPQDIDAEKSVIGSILIDKNSIINIVDFLRPDHFYKTSHQNIFTAIILIVDILLRFIEMILTIINI